MGKVVYFPQQSPLCRCQSRLQHWASTIRKGSCMCCLVSIIAHRIIWAIKNHSESIIGEQLRVLCIELGSRTKGATSEGRARISSRVKLYSFASLYRASSRTMRRFRAWSVFVCCREERIERAAAWRRKPSTYTLQSAWYIIVGCYKLTYFLHQLDIRRCEPIDFRCEPSVRRCELGIWRCEAVDFRCEHGVRRCEPVNFRCEHGVRRCEPVDFRFEPVDFRFELVVRRFELVVRRCKLGIWWLECTNIVGLSIYLSQQFLSEWFDSVIRRGGSKWKRAGIRATSNSLWLRRHCLRVVRWEWCSDKACDLRTDITHHWVCSSHQSTFCCPRHPWSKDWPFLSLHSLCFLSKPR